MEVEIEMVKHIIRLLYISQGTTLKKIPENPFFFLFSGKIPPKKQECG